MTIKEAWHGRSAELSLKDRTDVSRGTNIRPLRDYLVVEPIDTIYSSIIEVINSDKPMKGKVKAVGPGCYPKEYNGPKGKRTKSWDSNEFRPTQVKVGDVVELGGLQYGGYSFPTIYWGDKLHLICREEDVAFIYEA